MIQNNIAKETNLIRATKNNSPEGNTGVPSLPPTSNCFMYIETRSKTFGTNRHFSI